MYKPYDGINFLIQSDMIFGRSSFGLLKEQNYAYAQKILISIVGFYNYKIV